MNYFIFLLFSSQLSIVFSSAPRCLDESGNAVDWFVLYKLPLIKDHINPNIAAGTAYLYITSNTLKNGWQLSDNNISDPRSIPGRTLEIIYSEQSNNDINDIFWLFYNDQPPNENYTRDEGHTKGIVFGSHDGGVWIVHSVPHFPIVDSSEYQYPKTGHRYGQSFLCISLDKENLENIGGQLIINSVNTFNFTFQSNLKEVYPTIFKAAKKIRNISMKNKMRFNSIDKVEFISFAKSKQFNADLYSKWVAPILKTELFVETWMHENPLPSDCSTVYETHNIQVIKFDPAHVEFNNSHDHSKVAISASKGTFWVCVGDINRGSDQFVRAGGTVCFRNKDLNKAYLGIVSAVQPCPK